MAVQHKVCVLWRRFTPEKIVNEQVQEPLLEVFKEARASQTIPSHSPRKNTEKPAWEAVKKTNTGLYTVILDVEGLPLRVIVFRSDESTIQKDVIFPVRRAIWVVIHILKVSEIAGGLRTLS